MAQNVTRRNKQKCNIQPHQTLTKPEKSTTADANKKQAHKEVSTDQGSIPATHRKPISWVHVSITGVQFPDELTERIKLCREGISNITQQTEPDFVVVYVEGIPRGAISSVKKNLIKCLPSWAVLSVDFICKTT